MIASLRSVAFRPVLVAFGLLATAASAAPLRAQEVAAAAAGGAPLRAPAVRAEQAPVVDGRDDDTVWGRIAGTDAFQEFRPVEGKAPRYRTEFKAAYDDRNLYVFVRAYDPHPDSIRTSLTRRDVRGPSDQIKILVDAYHDRQSGFEFAVNPAGVKRDFAMYNDQDEDASWDGVWDVGTQIDSLGWTAEFRIPLSQLRYTNKGEHTFGFGVWRDIERHAERTSWPLYRSSQRGLSSQLGELVGITSIAPFRRLEIVPFGVAKNASERRIGAPVGAPAWGRDQGFSAGADLKYGITPNLTLDATVNPDFGQVEVDPSVVNLSAFETFFPERRPFFVEGSGLYRYSLNSTAVNRSSEGLFYSRRIGRAPQLLGVYGDEASPNLTPIRGAAKLTGRFRSGMNVGALSAVTGQEEGTLNRTIEPQTVYSVLRGQQELRAGRTSIGFIATGVNRSLDEWTRAFLRSDAYTAGTDLRHRWGSSQYEVNAKLTASSVRGSAAAIAQTQRSSVHLYQRPDDDISVDPTRTSLAGDGQEISVAKFGGSILRWLTSYERQSPGFEPNDLGFLQRANRQMWKNWMGLNFQKPTPLYRNMSLNFNFQEHATSQGLRTDRWVNSNGAVNLVNNMWVFYGASAYRLPGSFCDNCARGGPAVRSSPGTEWNVGWQGDDRRRIVPNIWYSSGASEGGKSTSSSFDPSVELRLLPQLQMSIGAGWSRNEDDVQWLGNFTDDAGVTHYAFSHLSQETRSASLRLSYTATPTLSLQVFAQPFVSRGEYTDVRELSGTPRADEYEARYVTYTPPASARTGFDIKEVVSNSIVRWEFRPGSTLFAVWTHGRSGFDPRFTPDRWNDEYRDLFALRPDNTFLVKVAYWISR